MDRILPNFLIIGAPKCATTSLWHYLGAHPQVFMCGEKEPLFFVGEELRIGHMRKPAPWTRGLDWYASLFAEGAGYPRRGEATTYYSCELGASHCAERMARCLPAARLIYLVREPVARLRSQYLQRLYGSDYPSQPPTLEAILAHGPEGGGQLALYYQDLVFTSLYHRQLSRYLEFFAQEQVLALNSDSLRNDRAQTLQTVYRFLDVDHAFSPPDIEREFNRSEDKFRYYWQFYTLVAKMPGGNTIMAKFPKSLKDFVIRSLMPRYPEHFSAISPAQIERLRELFAPDLAQFQALTGIEVSNQ